MKKNNCVLGFTKTNETDNVIYVIFCKNHVSTLISE